MSESGRMPYRWLAEYYDQVFAYHADWTESARRVILGPILPGVKSACDVACGTGTAAVRMAAAGVRMFGVDLSPVMCRLSREKARRLGVRLRVIRGDMRDFRIPELVDLVTCENDAVNHVPRHEDLARVARSVGRALRPGGHFYFDVNNLEGFRRYWPLTWFGDKGKVALVMHGGVDVKGRRAWSDVEWFIQEGKLWRRRHEHVEEICWTGTEVRQTLKAAGFDRVRAWDATPFMKNDGVTTRGCRTFYLARKAD